MLYIVVFAITITRNVFAYVCNLCAVMYPRLGSIYFFHILMSRERNILKKYDPCLSISRIPEGITLGELQADDAVILSKDWEGSRYRDDLEGYFRTVIENFESRCLRDASGDLLAYACMQFNGSIAMLYVKPEHRDKDYFKIVLADLARARLRKGEVAYGFIPTNDSELVNHMRSMDFVWVPGGDMVWMDYEPVRVNRSNSPPSITNTKLTGSPLTENKSKSIDCLCSDMAKFQKPFHDCRTDVGKNIKVTTATETKTTASNVTSLVTSNS